jgi:hypothetical protein
VNTVKTGMPVGGGMAEALVLTELGVRVPVPGQQLIEPLGVVIIDARKDVGSEACGSYAAKTELKKFIREHP